MRKHHAIHAETSRFFAPATMPPSTPPIGTSRGTRQLSAIRNLDWHPFDVLAGILFDQNFAVHRAALIPISVIMRRATWSTYTNNRIIYLMDDVWAEPRVVDVSARLQAVAVEF